MQTQRTEQTDQSMTNLSMLTPAEQRVLGEALHGLSTKEIANSLVLTEATIKSHLAHIYSKLGVRGRLDLLARFSEANSERSASDSLDSRSDAGRNSRFHRRKPMGPWLVYGLVPAMIAAGLVLFLATVWLVDVSGAPSIGFDDLEQLVAADSVAQLELTGSTLEVTAVDGSRYEITSVQTDLVRPFAVEHEVPFSVSSQRSESLELWQISLSVLPYAFLAILAWIVGVVLVRTLPRRDAAA